MLLKYVTFENNIIVLRNIKNTFYYFTIRSDHLHAVLNEIP